MNVDIDRFHMARALELARRGEGRVEPNPMVGCIIARGAETIGEGWHRQFGGPHAEVEALRVAGPRAKGATAYVTLEPCCHQGKTPPCSEALLAAGIGRVVVALGDPFPQVDGGGLAQLRAAGVEVLSGVLEDEAARLVAPYLKLLSTGRPWVIAKWAMTADGKFASRTGESRWISSDASRAVAHQLRGRVDAVIVGSGTAAADDPLLTARPPGPRVATRVVVDSGATLSPKSQLARTTGDAPVLVAAGPDADDARCRALSDAGCEVWRATAGSHAERQRQLLEELGRRRMTNVLVEGGARLLGSLFDARLIDEVHVFIAPKLLGGAESPTPLAGQGISAMPRALQLKHPQWQTIEGGDVYLTGRLATEEG